MDTLSKAVFMDQCNNAEVRRPCQTNTVLGLTAMGFHTPVLCKAQAIWEESEILCLSLQGTQSLLGEKKKSYTTKASGEVQAGQRKGPCSLLESTHNQAFCWQTDNADAQKKRERTHELA